MLKDRRKLPTFLLGVSLIKYILHKNNYKGRGREEIMKIILESVLYLTTTHFD